MINRLLALISANDVKIPKAELNDAQFSSLFSVVLAVAAVTAVGFIILGGIKYSISQGNASDLEKAKNMILYAVVGLVIVILAFAIVQAVTANIFT